MSGCRTVTGAGGSYDDRRDALWIAGVAVREVQAMELHDVGELLAMQGEAAIMLWECPSCGSVVFGGSFINGSGPWGSSALRKERRCGGCGLYWTPEQLDEFVRLKTIEDDKERNRLTLLDEKERGL